MELIDLYLRTDTREEMMQALRDAGLMRTDTDDNGGTVERIDGAPLTSVAVLGVMHEQTGTEMVDGEEVPVFEPIPGWHVNIRTRDESVADALLPLAVAPDTPRVVWAG